MPACYSEGEGSGAMNQNALVYIFGAVSAAPVGLVFLYKWWIDVIQGVGPGLSLVTRIAELLGGKLTLDADSPTGTIATISFPRVEPAPQATASWSHEDA